MKPLLPCFLLISLFPVILFGQSPAVQPSADTLPEHFRFEVPAIRDHVYQQIPAELKEQTYPRSSLKYADQVALELQYLMGSGTVYSDWPELEEYVNQVLQKVAPQELLEEPFLYAYLLKDGSYNAFMSPIGAFYVNIGLFAFMPDEATLAGVIAHELAHYYQKHAIQGFVKAISGEFRPGFLQLNKGSASQFSVEGELEADSLAALWLDQAGYAIEGLIESTRILERLDQQALLRSFDQWEIEQVTHPRPQERTEKLQRLAEQQAQEDPQHFLVSELTFRKLSHQAKPEILKHLLQNFEYEECIEKAFTFHLYEPTNPAYIYFILEGIRRNCYLNADLWTQRFIANRYYEIEERKVGGVQKIKRKTEFLDHFDPTILALTDTALADIKANFYWNGDLKFKTYEDAYLFFSRVGEVLKSPECLLSNAILFNFNPTYQKELLEKYLKYPAIAHREYAEHLLAGTLQSSLPAERLTVLSTFFGVTRQGDEDILVRDEAQTSQAIPAILAGIQKARANNQCLYLLDLQYHQQTDYSILKELEGLSLIRVISKGQKTELHALDPRYWEAMQRLGVNEIEFILCSVFETQKGSSERSDYQAILEMNTDTFLQRTKVNRYVDIMITSLREIPNGVPKVVFYGGEDKLAYRDPGEAQIIELLKEKLLASDERTQELDQLLQSSTKE